MWFLCFHVGSSFCQSARTRRAFCVNANAYSCTSAEREPIHFKRAQRFFILFSGKSMANDMQHIISLYEFSNRRRTNGQPECRRCGFFPCALVRVFLNISGRPIFIFCVCAQLTLWPFGGNYTRWRSQKRFCRRPTTLIWWLYSQCAGRAGAHTNLLL